MAHKPNLELQPLVRALPVASRKFATSTAPEHLAIVRWKVLFCTSIAPVAQGHKKSEVLPFVIFLPAPDSPSDNSTTGSTDGGRSITLWKAPTCLSITLWKDQEIIPLKGLPETSPFNGDLSQEEALFYIDHFFPLDGEGVTAKSKLRRGERSFNKPSLSRVKVPLMEQ